MREGKFPTIAELVAGSDGGSLDEYVYNLKTGGQVRLGFPGSRSQSLTFTDCVQIAHAADLAHAARLYAAGWLISNLRLSRVKSRRPRRSRPCRRPTHRNGCR